MSLIKTYESRKLEHCHYAMFFFEPFEPGIDSVVVLCVLHDPDPDGEWGSPEWSVWHLDVTHDEIYDVAVDLESEEPRYDTYGMSAAYGTLDEVLADLGGFDMDGVDEMIEEVVYFFGK